MMGMAARRKKASWGGRRPGAGRNGFLKDPHRLTLDFEGEDYELLEELAKERDESVGQVVRTAVSVYLRRLRRK